MRKVIIALLASTALAVPAFAATNATPPKKPPQHTAQTSKMKKPQQHSAQKSQMKKPQQHMAQHRG
jgi:hypothetical protein